MNHQTIVHLGYPVAIANRSGRLISIASCKLLFEPVARLAAMLLRQHHESTEKCATLCFLWTVIWVAEASWPNYNVPCWYKRDMLLRHIWARTVDEEVSLWKCIAGITAILTHDIWIRYLVKAGRSLCVCVCMRESSCLLLCRFAVIDR
jgi:hypothetical protein